MRFGLGRKQPVDAEIENIYMIKDIQAELSEAVYFLEQRGKMLQQVKDVNTESLPSFREIQKLIIYLRRLLEKLENVRGRVPDNLMKEVHSLFENLEKCISFLSADDELLTERIAYHENQIQMIEEIKSLNKDFKSTTVKELKKIGSDIEHHFKLRRRLGF